MLIPIHIGMVLAQSALEDDTEGAIRAR